jgi:hypothetical protein
MTNHGSLANIEKLESDLWEAADNLRANSKLGDEIAYATKCIKAWHERGDSCRVNVANAWQSGACPDPPHLPS